MVKLYMVVTSLVAAAVMVGALYMIVVFVEGLANPTSLKPLSIRIALSCAFVVGAILIYALKNSRSQFAYGLAEIAIGLMVNWRSLDSWFHPTTGSGLRQPSMLRHYKRVLMARSKAF
jgi:hypothetical protein